MACGPVSGSSQALSSRWVVRGRVVVPREPEHHEGDQERPELQPVLEGLHQCDAAHPAGRHGDQHDHGHHHGPHPGRSAGEGLEGESGALQLRHQVEHADQADQPARHPPRGRRLHSELREVGQRVGTRTTQRSSHEDQQEQVPDRPPDRVPEHVDTAREHQSGHSEERRRGQVLTTDGRGVEDRADASRRDEEVARRARDPHPEGADGECRRDHQGHGQQRDGLSHRGSSGGSAAPGGCWPTRSTNAASLCSARRTYHHASTSTHG